MKLVDCFQATEPLQVAFVGAGGKTSAMFRLAHQLPDRSILTTTTHLGVDQAGLADRHLIVQNLDQLKSIVQSISVKTTLLTGPETQDGRLSALEPGILDWLHEACNGAGINLLIEADGSKGLPLKAPAEHEPAIPAWIGTVMVVAGMNGVNQPLGSDNVHRPDRFAAIAGILAGEIIAPESLVKVLIDPSGGQKNIPMGAARVVLLNQADTDELQSQAGRMAEKLKASFRVAIIGSLKRVENEVVAAYKPVAGIILAAGGSSRFGRSKPLLDWKGKPFVHQVIRTAREAGLDPIIVITGFEASTVQAAVADLSVKCAFNPDWASGQSTSVKAGIYNLEADIGAAIFLLADQPQIKPSLLRAELELYYQTLGPVVAPLIDGRRANPVLFDRAAFPALNAISGDSGGRQVFSQFSVKWLEWNDPSLLLDVDTPEDYERLLKLQ